MPDSHQTRHALTGVFVADRRCIQVIVPPGTVARRAKVKIPDAGIKQGPVLRINRMKFTVWARMVTPRWQAASTRAGFDQGQHPHAGKRKRNGILGAVDFDVMVRRDAGTL